MQSAMRREVTAGVDVVYTKDCDADIFITAEAKAQRAAGAPRVVVVSGDTEISASLEYRAAMGWMTAEMYLLEMKRVSCEALLPTLRELHAAKPHFAGRTAHAARMAARLK